MFEVKVVDPNQIIHRILLQYESEDLRIYHIDKKKYVAVDTKGWESDGDYHRVSQLFFEQKATIEIGVPVDFSTYYHDGVDYTKLFLIRENDGLRLEYTRGEE